ncbi:DUF1993 family protein [Xinfangfangia sp. CPCC 101601]|uniref:DUF1993 family protein n=1 Tax=Pseudogemmobacter lacusdianii TaxID=3069608 RepID=A0ABU0VSV5_9RHOB|nr:DUF1993 family protein [Xinfangfangia sp. CPCC 101601]MDQ2064802.1 DUF1993 family protein [Xinfangfangia sp. CPCC 101601]
MYQASVPVFRHYLSRISDIVALAGPDALDAQIADTFPARSQFAIAAGFSMRVCCLLAGRDAVDLPENLGPRLAVARATLGSMRPAEFEGAESRVITHRAGFADVEQTGAQYLYLYGLPNFFFHMTMGYAALRSAGLALGKEDFDGIHSYPADFRF